MAVREEYGTLTPSNVVDAARPDDHPLHSRFEWDDSIAGEQWRAAQAAELIRSVRVVFTSAKGEEVSVREFHSIVRDGQPVYQPTRDVVADELSTQSLLRDLKRDLERMRHRYSHLREYIDLLRAELSAA